MIKIFAIIFMVCDHAGIFLFPEYAVPLRSIGAMAFPLFAWMIAQGRRLTSDINQYLLSLLLFAMISEPVHKLMFPETANYNAMFTLFIGLFFIRLCEQYGRVAFYALAPLFLYQYVSLYILLVFLFYYVPDKYLQALGLVFFFGFVGLISHHFYVFAGVFSLGFIMLDRFHFRLPVNKYVFYAFYPVHFLIIRGIQYVVN